MPLGAHMSIAGGIHKALERGQNIGCECIQIFTKNPRQWAARQLSDEDIRLFQQRREETGIDPIVAHDSYLINLGSPKEELWHKSLESFACELDRCALLGVPYLVMHPGSHASDGEEISLQRVSEAFDQLFDRSSGEAVMVLLETTAGQRSSLGSGFEQLARIIELVKRKERLGICFDTCHAFAAGYELRTRQGYERTFQELGQAVGLSRLKAFHLNDSKQDLGSHVDRHEHIGKGYLGLEPFRMILNDPRFRGLPMLLETPKGKDMAEDVENLAVLRGLIEPSQ
ncbi:MAG: deoxyribonuclease IV [Chloroflexota bacterium]